MKRRELLITAGSLSAGIAGCTARPTADASEESDEKELILAYVKISNHHQEQHTVDVLIEKDDDVFSWDSYGVDRYNPDSNAAGIKWVIPEPTDSRGEWSIATRLRSEATGLNFELNKHPYPDGSCVGIVIRISDDGTLRFIDDLTDCDEWKITNDSLTS